MAQTGDQFSAIWSVAKQRYAQVAGRDLDDPLFPHPSSIDDLITSLDDQNKEFKQFREKRGTFFDVLNGACKPIELVANLAAGGAAMAFPPSTLCFGAAMYLVNAAHGVSASYDAIEGLLGTLKDFLVRLTVYNREDLPIKLREKLAEILAVLLEIFAQSTKLVMGGSRRRVLQFSKNALLGNDEKLRGLVTKLEKMTQSEAQLVGAETLIESKKTGRRVDSISVTLTETSMAVQDGNFKLKEVSTGVHQIAVNQDEFRQEIHRNFGNVMAALNERAEVKDDKDKKCLDRAKALLKPSVSPVDIFLDISKKRVPGTGDWIRNEELFMSWMDQENPVLWISGNPGSGKSYLSGNIIAYLQEQHPQGVQHPSRISIGYFFFKDSDPQTRSFHQALRDLAYQISQNDPVYAKYIDSQCQSPDDIRTIRSAWRKLFVEYFIKNDRVDSSVYLVVDGVDEAYEAERQLFLELLSDLKDSEHGDERRSSRIHLVMIGRPQIIDDINEALETSVPTIHVDWRKNSEDIVHYVESSIRKSKVLSRTPKSLQEEIVETLTKNAKGMFIWCDLMMRELSKKSRASAIRESLHHVPKGLTPMLRHVLESFSVTLKEEGPDDLNTMLAWVACAARPLTLGELDTILKLKSSEGDEVLYLEGKLRKQFASFFTLMREDGLSTADLQGDAKTQYVPEREDEDADEKEGLEDIENETDFTSNPGTTYVTFCHASIGEFLRDEKQGMVSAGEDNPAVGVNIIEAKTTVLKTCLKLICDPNLYSKMKGSPSLQPYATECWHKHLQAAAGDLTKISVSEKQDVGELLVKLLRDEDAITAWVGQQNYEFFTAETLKTLTLWLEDKEILDSPPAEDREWIQSALQSHAEIFVPAAKILANQWLQDTFWNPIGIMACIHFITSLLRGESVESLPDPMPLQTILDAAEWPQFEKNALWHRRLAMCLRDYQFYDEAMDHFESALKMDEKMWRARSGMALIHALRGKHEKQIEILKGYVPILRRELEEQKEASDFNPKNEGIWNLSETYGKIAEAYGKLDDWANSLEYYRKAFEVESQDYSYLERIVYILGRKQEPKDYEGIIKLIKSMEDPIEGEDYTLLTECISTYKWFDEDFFQICAEAAKETNELAWLRNAYLAAISTARQELEPVLTITLEVCLGELLAKYGRDQVQAARLWERVIRVATVAGGTDSALINFCKDAVVKRFSTFCLQKALDAGKGSPEADKYIKKLERLCKQKAKATGDALELVTTNYSAVYLGLWYRLIKQEQEARAYFQPWIKETLMILSDDDPDNDDIGYYYLGHVLLAAGDEVNALAVLHALKPIRRKDVTTESKDESSKVKATEEKPSEDDAGSSRTHAKQEAEEEEKEKRLSGESNNESSSDKENLVIEEKPSSKEGNVITEEEKPSVTQDAQPPAEENRGDVPPNPATIDFNQLMRQVYPQDTYSYPWCCDGVCDRSFPTFVNGNVCRYCLADLCEDCLSLVKDDALAVHMICNPHHEWLHVPLLPELSARLMTASGSAEERKRSIAPPTAGGEVFVAGRKVDLEDFNAGLRREWKV